MKIGGGGKINAISKTAKKLNYQFEKICYEPDTFNIKDFNHMNNSFNDDKPGSSEEKKHSPQEKKYDFNTPEKKVDSAE